FDRRQQQLLETVDQALRAAGVVLVTAVRVVHLPVDPFRDRRRLTGAAEVETQKVAGRQVLNAGEAGGPTGQGEEREHMIDAASVGPRLDQAGREDRLDLAAEDQP